MQILEGKQNEGPWIIEFPSLEEAKRWYYSPEYQSAAVYRKNGAEFDVSIVDAVGK